jgi:hypothetical protein
MMACRALGLTFLTLVVNLGSVSSIQADDCPPSTVDWPKIVTKKGEISTGTWVQLGDTVTVVIDGSCRWLRDKKVNPTELRLYLAGQLVENAGVIVPNLHEDYVKFDLKIDPARNREQWVKILRAAREASDEAIGISVGHPPSQTVFRSSSFIILHVYPRYTAVVTAALAALLVLIVVLAARTDLLRVPREKADTKPPLSLGLVQMAWWFYLVVAGFVYVWLITGEHDTLSEGVLALMGISAATGLGAVFVDSQKRESVAAARRALSSQEQALTNRITEIGAPAAGTDLDKELQQKRSDLALVAAQLTNTPSMPAPSTKGWWRDLLSDGSGQPQFHRLQVAVWTLVLGTIFIRLVSRDLTMPQFSSMLLGLMGLSSGTFLGFKFPEAPK